MYRVNVMFVQVNFMEIFLLLLLDYFNNSAYFGFY